VNLKKVCSIIILLIFVFPSISFSLSLKDFLSVDVLTKSIENEPDQWVITHNYAVFFGNSSLVRKIKGLSFPEVNGNAKITIYFNLYRGKIQLEKPKGPWYEGSDLKKMIRTIKTHKYNKYKKELGIKDETKIVIKEIERKNKTGMRKLY